MLPKVKATPKETGRDRALPSRPSRARMVADTKVRTQPLPTFRAVMVFSPASSMGPPPVGVCKVKKKAPLFSVPSGKGRPGFILR